MAYGITSLYGRDEEEDPLAPKPPQPDAAPSEPPSTELTRTESEPAPSAPAPAPSPAPAPTEAPTFSDLQAQGIARPAPPPDVSFSPIGTEPTPIAPAPESPTGITDLGSMLGYPIGPSPYEPPPIYSPAEPPAPYQP